MWFAAVVSAMLSTVVGKAQVDREQLGPLCCGLGSSPVVMHALG